MRIGFIGLGAMGAPMAARLVQAGHVVRGFDVRTAAVDALAAAGGQAALSARDAAQGAELLWLMVVNGEQAEAVLFGNSSGSDDGGAAAALPAGAIVVAACTQAPAQARRLAERLAAAGLVMLDAPVSGGVAGATAGSLSVMCSGPAGALASARAVFDAVAG
ncbi:MAG: NAD(P)-binding domain-containing protein, partial [Rhizobacter sp.]|nr:NAD(P)-binding domain-containing protein [Rhizobacter sp.]